LHGWLGTGTPLAWGLFALAVGGMLALDLGVFQRKSHVVGAREALAWTLVWATVAVCFGGMVVYTSGETAGWEYLTAWVVEKSLAVDNIFVFVAVFSAFAVPANLQHRVLYWGVLGAIALRAVFVFLGAALIEQFHAVLYVFGAVLLFTGLRMMFLKESHEDVGNSWWYRLVRRLIPATDGYRGQRFFVREAGRRLATPLFLVLLVIEGADLVFAVDSIPAVFGISQDPFVVLTSNIFAILGLRSMYFLLADLVPRFVYLKFGLSMVLVFVGAKMLVADLVHVPIVASLGAVVGLVGGSIAASLWATRGQAAPERAPR
jgi:tellurite resistance protein TerC